MSIYRFRIQLISSSSRLALELLMVAIIGGEPHSFRPLIDRYREAGLRTGHSPDRLKVGIHSLGYVANSSTTARKRVFSRLCAKLH